MLGRIFGFDDICVCVCVCVYIYIYVYIFIITICAYVYIFMYFCVYVCKCVYMLQWKWKIWQLSTLTSYFAECSIKLGNVNNGRFFVKSPCSFT